LALDFSLSFVTLSFIVILTIIIYYDNYSYRTI